MEEKKLTDEEIVKALDICYNFKGCTNECPYFNKNGRNFCMKDKALYKDLKDLIHRLHAEVEELRKAKVIHETVDYCYEDLKDAQAEIERLSKKAVVLEVETNNQKAEIERLKEEIERQKDAKFRAVLDKYELRKINAELQKQVDELNQQFLSTCENCHLKKDLELLRYQKQQAVKDTAREILVKAPTDTDADERFIHWLRERYGVEVE